MTETTPQVSSKQRSKKFLGTGISIQGIVMVFLAACLMASASLMLRASIDLVGGFGGEISRLHEDIFRLILQPIFLLGVLLYGGGTLLWMRVISTEPLSIGYPILVSVSFVAISLGAAFFFEEAMTWTKAIGMAVILMGVIIASNG